MMALADNDLSPDPTPEEHGGAPADSPADGADAAADSASAGAANAASAPAGTERGENGIVRDGMKWYVLRVASNKEQQIRATLERKVKIEQLEERVGRILVPMKKEKRVRGGAARVYHLKLYPGYVFVEMATEPDGSIPESVWFLIKETTGVGDFISSAGKPSPMPMHDVEKMLAAAVTPDESPALANVNFNKGDRVKVTEGAFENFEGVVDEINSQKGTVRVIATIFGRPTPIDLEYWQLEKV